MRDEKRQALALLCSLFRRPLFRIGQNWLIRVAFHEGVTNAASQIARHGIPDLGFHFSDRAAEFVVVGECLKSGTLTGGEQPIQFRRVMLDWLRCQNC
jgi:hypothetical protein